MLLQQSPFRGEDEDEIYDAILADEPLYPIHMPRDSVSILQKLLTREPELRLGSGPTDAQEVMSHAFFRNINWDDIYHKRVPPPFLPTISNPTDTSNFDTEFTSVTPVLTPVQSGKLFAARLFLSVKTNNVQCSPRPCRKNSGASPTLRTLPNLTISPLETSFSISLCLRLCVCQKRKLGSFETNVCLLVLLLSMMFVCLFPYFLTHWAHSARHTHESLYSSISHENSNDSSYGILDFRIETSLDIDSNFVEAKLFDHISLPFVFSNDPLPQ